MLALVHKDARRFLFELSSIPTVMSFNSTLAATPLYDQLYGNTNYLSLNWYEQQWVAWYIWIGNPIIATGLMSFIMHEV